MRRTLTALREDKGSAPKRLLLLLATQNADKAPKPAAFEQRLVMMRLLAQDIRQELEKEAGATEEQQPPDDASSQDHNAKRGTGGHESHSPAIPAIDIAVTIHPMFIHKSLAIAQSGSYSASPPPSSEDSSSPPTPSCEQVHIIGYDTLIRLLDTRYYPPEHTLAPLIPFMAAHRLRVTYRRPDPSSEAERKWGSREVQHGYLNDLAEGKREDEGGQRVWAVRGVWAVGLTVGAGGGGGVVSSTRARKAAKAGDEGLLRGLVCGGVADWIVKEKLYTNDE
jgi:nicotinamide-nucleotide adenylyltransferase